MDISQLLTGGLTGAAIVYIALQVFNRIIDRTPLPPPDATAKWLELAGHVLDGFKSVAGALDALTENIKQSNTDSASDRKESAALFEKVSMALDGVQKALNDFKTDLKGEFDLMKDESKTRLTLENETATKRYNETDQRLTTIEQNVKGIKRVLDDSPLAKPDALTTLREELTKAVTDALDIRLPNARADPTAAPPSNTPVSDSTDDNPDTEPEDKPDVNPT